MSRIIIDNRSSLSDVDATLAVAKVIEQGRISNDNKQYCYLTTFTNGLVVATDLNKKSDKFIVIDNKT